MAQVSQLRFDLLLSSAQGILLVGLSFAWLGSELVLALRRRSSRKISAKKRERRSLSRLSIIITASLVCGVALGLQPYGTIELGRPYLTWAGLGLMVVGFVVRMRAIRTLGDYFTVAVAIQEEHKLVDQGPYRIIRHPAYAGSLLSFLGLGTAFGNWITITVIFVPILIAFLDRISVEERLMTAEFGHRYVDYMRRTRRLIPRIY